MVVSQVGNDKMSAEEEDNGTSAEEDEVEEIEEDDGSDEGEDDEDDDEEEDDEDDDDDEGEEDEEGAEEMETFAGTDGESEMEKALSTQNQLRIWDALLEARIRMQRMLLESNKLPQLNDFKDITDDSKGKELQLQSVSVNTLANIQDFLGTLLQLQESITQGNPETFKAISKKRKIEDGNSSKINKDDEEITSSEDEGNDEKNIPPVSIDEEEEDETVTKPKEKKRKKMSIKEFEKTVDNQFKSFIPYRNETIQKWNEKTQLSFGKYRGKNGSASQIPTLKQISHILADRPRLIKKTQVKRTAYSIIRKEGDNNQVEEGNAQDEEIFDDDDFYHQLLRELIDRKTTNVNDPVQLTRHWLELQKLRSKLKRVVDTKASKGRQIRYDVKPKLVNFMAPQDNCIMSDNAVKELMSSLFGKSA